MTSLRTTTFAGVTILLVLGCQRDPPTSAPTTSPATAPAATRPAALLGELVYTRTGGFVGTNNRVSIQPDGTLRATGKMFGEHAGVLTPAQRADLAALFADWPTLEVSGRPPEGAADYFELSLTYGGKTLTWTSLTPGVPEELKRLARTIEELARSVK